MSEQPYKRVEPIGEAEGPTKLKLSDTTESDASAKAKFEAAVEKADTSKVERRVDIASEPAVNETKKQSLLDLATKATNVPQKVAPTPKMLSDQATSLKNQIARPRAVLLEAADAPLDGQSIATLSSHLEHINRSLRDVTKLTTGVDVETAPSITAEKSPAIRFLSYLTESDKQLSNLVTEIDAMQNSKTQLTPAKLLAVQIKLGFVQQELEFFTTVLNKALESTKTIMNVQI